MSRAKRVDSNQKSLVSQMRKIPGLTVAHTHTVGGGFPDLLLGWRGRNILVELKNPRMAPSQRRLTEDEIEWHQKWTGQIAIIHTLEDVLKLLELSTNGV